ncbi:MAG: YhcH/YjgK/YiaL family protein [Melioribacteraceae bacterium]|nr:YhcH/YjgK/YiaL family protein [Saprospiraceae bacterium]MCF8355748.1 YhcH/YjgK/YiaL family protein [Melioribacteraceae bacterium]MCF8394776.1 YhcH/YjgK/YiaL family protein [Melioribacteraceae bacterium]
MILDLLSNISFYKKLSPNIKDAINSAAAIDFSILDNGKHSIKESEIYVIVNSYETKQNINSILEGHKKYIDFHFLLEGSEVIDYEPLINQRIVTEYNDVEDYCLFSCRTPSKLRLEKGLFALFFPSDLHYTGIAETQPSYVKKVVIKIEMESL